LSDLEDANGDKFVAARSRSIDGEAGGSSIVGSIRGAFPSDPAITDGTGLRQRLRSFGAESVTSKSRARRFESFDAPSPYMSEDEEYF
jgi:hypothetical protein